MQTFNMQSKMMCGQISQPHEITSLSIKWKNI